MANLIAITKVSIDNIKEVQEYKDLMPENNKYEELKGSIQQLGFLDPIMVNKNYEILDGYTRFRIAKELGIKEIPVEIYETSGREEELDMIASFNLKRRQLSNDEIVALIDKIAEKKKALKTQIIEKFEEQKNENESEQNAISPYRILPADTDKISTKQESREIKEELNRLAPNVQINEETIRQYLQVKKEVPWLVQYIGDKKNGKIGIEKAYEIYRLLKEKNLLDLDKRLPKSELSSLITDKYGRKVLDRDDLLQLILDHKMAVSQAINKIKMEKKASRSKKKSNAEESKEIEKEKEGEELESEVEQKEDSENEEYPFAEEWQKAAEEETKQQLTPQEEAPPTKTEVYIPKADLDSLYKAMPSIKKLVDAGKLTEKDAEKVYEIWRNMEAIFKQASLLWYNTIDIMLKKAGLSEEERKEIFLEMVRPYFRLFSREEVFPKEVLEGKL
ncbi:MAG: ParB N-terminal domain-containing protein [Sulfolobaceae archaeon]